MMTELLFFFLNELSL